MRGVCLGDRHHPAGSLVETVDEPRPLAPPDAGKTAVLEMKQERVDERSAPMAGGRMNDDPRGFVQD